MYRVSTAVIDEPLTIDEVKLHLRLNDDSIEDSWLYAKVQAAREHCEDFTGRALATQTVQLFMDYWPANSTIKLPKPPLQSVTAITYKDSAGTETTVSSADYIVDTDSPEGRIVPAYGLSWPLFTPYPINPIKVTCVSGYTACPESIKAAMLLLIGHWYENREAVIVGTISSEVAKASDALLMPYKHRWWD